VTDPLREELAAYHGIELDRFQEEAIDALRAGESVLVAAPTSSGKTLVAEYAVLLADTEHRRLFYTTPIKALSNQKFRDLGRWLGPDKVGLLTGDNVIRPDAPVVVMTTEVLRNMIYVRSPALQRLSYVVLDEVHFLQDAYRGPVWEEIILQLDPAVRLVALSATVSNSSELAAWIGTVRGPTAEVVERSRPVELENHYLVKDGRKSRLREFPMLRAGRPNREVERFLATAGPGRGGRSGLRTPRRVEIVEHLRARDRLPAIYFLFSRQGCDEAARTCVRSGLALLAPPERDRVAAIAARHTAGLSPLELRVLGVEEWLAMLQAGFAAHHAGLIPPLKETIEECFAAGLCQVVFATETLAMGVNLPARSVVIESLSRFRGEGHVLLTPGDYTQLTGRAGRRGIDVKGHAYTLYSPYVPFEQVASLASSRQFELSSAFRPTYNMAANLVAGYAKDQVAQLLSRSFAQYQADREIVEVASRLDRSRGQLTSDIDELASRFGEEEPVEEPVADGASEVIEADLLRLRPGQVIDVDTSAGSARLLVLGVGQRRNAAPRLRVLTRRGKTLQLAAAEFRSVPDVLTEVELPKPFAPFRPAFQRAAAELLRSVEAHHPLPGRGPGDGDDEPGDDGDERRSAAANRARDELARRIARRRADVVRWERRLSQRTDGLQRRFEAIVEVLGDWGYLDGWELTAKGAMLRRIFHERDLLVSEALATGLFDGLDPQDLAALVSTLTYERRSPHPPPAPWFPNEEVRRRFQALDALHGRLAALERTSDLPETAEPDPGFVAAAHGWAAGLDIADVLTDEDLAPGDFVRQVRQLVDLLQQLARAAPDPATVEAARAALRRLDRDLVAAATAIDADAS
jgi:ATP-dependent RNA helicase HelY